MKHRLKPGFSHYHNGEELSPGAEIELSESGAVAFADRFEPVSETETEASPSQDQPEREVVIDVDAVATEPEKEAAEIIAFNALEAITYIQEVESAALASAIIAAEEVGKGRKGVLYAARTRLEELEK